MKRRWVLFIAASMVVFGVWTFGGLYTPHRGYVDRHPARPIGLALVAVGWYIKSREVSRWNTKK